MAGEQKDIDEYGNSTPYLLCPLFECSNPIPICGSASMVKVQPSPTDQHLPAARWLTEKSDGWYLYYDFMAEGSILIDHRICDSCDNNITSLCVDSYLCCSFILNGNALGKFDLNNGRPSWSIPREVEKADDSKENMVWVTSLRLVNNHIYLLTNNGAVSKRHKDKQRETNIIPGCPGSRSFYCFGMYVVQIPCF